MQSPKQCTWIHSQSHKDDESMMVMSGGLWLCKSDADYRKRIEEDTSAKSIKLKTTIQPPKEIFHLKINTTISTTKRHSKEVVSTQEEEEGEEEEEHP
jgi:hypothetical protein